MVNVNSAGDSLEPTRETAQLTRNEVGSNVDDNAAGLEPLALDKLGLADGGDNNVGILESLLDIGSPRVALRDGRVTLAEESADGRTDNVGPAEDDSLLASNGNAGRVEEVDDSGGGAGREERGGETGGKVANVGGMETVASKTCQTGLDGHTAIL